MEEKAWIGVDIGGTKTAVAISREPPAMLARIEFPTLPEQGPERAIGLITQSIHEVLRTTGIDRAQVGGIGVSCGGPLDQRAGVIQAPPNLATWVDVPIASILRGEFALECKLENDADAGAVAEHRYGAGRGTRHMVFLTMGTGLGAGIIADGRLLRGASGQAGEIGHVRLSADGPMGYHKAGSGGGMGQRRRHGARSCARSRSSREARRTDDAGREAERDDGERCGRGGSRRRCSSHADYREHWRTARRGDGDSSGFA